MIAVSTTWPGRRPGVDRHGHLDLLDDDHGAADLRPDSLHLLHLLSPCCVRSLADSWETDLFAAIGKPASDLTSDDKVLAYTRVATQSATRAELLFLLEGSTTPDYAAPWEAVKNRWAPPAATDPAHIDQFIARLAADGLWLYECLSGEHLTTGTRQAIAERIAEIALPEDN